MYRPHTQMTDIETFLTMPRNVGYDAPVAFSKDATGGESPNEAATAALAPVSAAFSRLSPIHPRVRNEHADSLAARAKGAARLAGASSVSQPSFRAATTFESVAAVNQTANEVQTMANIATISFHDQSIIAIEHEGKHFVALRPIVENIGLDWKSQYARIKRNHVLNTSVVMMTTQMPGDDQRREVLCLPLTMLNGWLFGVDVNRVNPELRDKLMVYQRECFDVLARHFMPAQRPHNPAIDYDRISPAQAQDLKEIVAAIVQAGIQGYGETWARLQRKFRVNSYLELPAAWFDEARDYLLGKLPEAPAQKLPDADRLKQAYAMATEAGVQMQRAVFNAVVDGTDEQMTYGRVIAALTFDRQGRKIIPHAQYLAGNQMVIAFEDIPQRIDDGSILATDVQLAEVALAIARKQSQRAASRANQQRLG